MDGGVSLSSVSCHLICHIGWLWLNGDVVRNYISFIIIWVYVFILFLFICTSINVMTQLLHAMLQLMLTNLWVMNFGCENSSMEVFRIWVPCVWAYDGRLFNLCFAYDFRYLAILILLFKNLKKLMIMPQLYFIFLKILLRPDISFSQRFHLSYYVIKLNA